MAGETWNNYKWGSTELKIIVGTTKTDSKPSPLTETQVLPNPAALTDIATVIQQQGRKRARSRARLVVASMSEYNAFVTDMDAGTTRLLVIEVLSVSGNHKIESVGEEEFKRHDMIFFDIVWIEVI
jgi:hypothetical protein